MKKALALCIVSLLLILSFTGCAKVVDVQQETVEVKVINTDRTAAWIQPVRAGKVTTYIHHSAEYNVIVEYNGNYYTFDNKEMYHKYTNRIGCYTTAVLETKTYDNGKVKWALVELK